MFSDYIFYDGLLKEVKRDTNSVWRKTAAYSCMFLLDFPLSVVYTCIGGILAIPALNIR